MHCPPQDTSAPWGPLNRLLSPELMETFAQWVTFVPRVEGHLDPVLLAASFRNLEPLLSLSVIPAPPGNTALTLEVHNLQVGMGGGWLLLDISLIIIIGIIIYFLSFSLRGQER